MQIKDSRIDKPYQMQCLPLYSIMKAAGQTRIDFLSLDVEGAEYGILQTLFEQKIIFSNNFGQLNKSKYYVKMIFIEFKSSFEIQILNILGLLVRNDFFFSERGALYLNGGTI